MNNDLIKIAFNGRITPVKPINKQFTLCKCYVMAIGKNAHNSIIDKEAVDDALPSLFNTPVVGHLYADSEGNIVAGGHDMVLEKDDDGKYKFKNITVPYGVVPQQNELQYEEVVESDGSKNIYLVADIILWTSRYPELLEAIYNDDIFFAQSMEIVPSEIKKEKDGLRVKKFQFSALCLLGKSDDTTKNVVPCFKSARIEPYKFSDKEIWTELFTEFKDALAQSYSEDGKSDEKGGNEKLNIEKIKAILLEFGLSVETDLPFEINESMTEDQLREKIKETHANFTEDNGNDGNHEISFAIDKTYEEKRKALSDALEKCSTYDRKDYSWFTLIDFDDAFAYVYYHRAGDGIKEERRMIRIPYVFDSNEAILNLEKREPVRHVWLTKEDEDKISASKEKLEELTRFKADRLESDKRQAYAAIISEFSDLGELDEYKTVVKDAMTFESADGLAEKLFAIRGKNAGVIAKKPLEKMRIPIKYAAETKSDYEQFICHYNTKITKN